MIKSKQIQRPQLVLVVDDQEINRDVLGMILEDDYEVIYAENGREALDIMRERLDELSIVLLDLMMPVMNGFEVLKTVRADEQLRQVPIIVLTAEKKRRIAGPADGRGGFYHQALRHPRGHPGPRGPHHRIDRGQKAHLRRRA